MTTLHLAGQWSHAARRALLKSPVWLALKATPRAVYNTLWLYSDTSGKPVWPSHRALAEAVGVTVATIKRSIRALESAGLVERVARYSPEGDQTSNTYHLTLPPGSAVTPPPVTDDPQISGAVKFRRTQNQEQPDSPSGLRPTGEISMARKTAQDTDTLWSKASPDPERTQATPDPVARARERLADPTHHEKQARTAKSAAAALANYWHDKRATTDPKVKPPAPTPVDRGQAGHVIGWLMVDGVSPLDAFRKARALLDLAFSRACWPFNKGEPIVWRTLGRREIFDSMCAAEDKRRESLPDWQRKGFATFADWVEAENARGGFRRVG